MASMNQDEKDLYLDVLREGTTPFDRFVARGSMQDSVDIPGPRKGVDSFLFRAIRQTEQDHSTRLIPILGSAGCGKTHAYWAYKALEKRQQQVQEGTDSDLPANLPTNWTIVYVPSPPAATRVLLHVYTCLLDELKVDILKTVANKLVDRWGGFKKKKIGIFGGQDIEETIQIGIREYPGIFADAVKCLVIFALDKERGAMAERWLLGEDLDETELDKLGINSVIESDDICLAMTKLICENAGKCIVLYFDELESPYRMHGPEAEQKFLETLKRLYNEIKNVIIVIAVLKEIWPRLQEIMDTALKSRMEQERDLKVFTFDDLLLYFAKAMAYFWAQNNLNPPAYPLFPMNEDVLKIIYNKTEGNARQIIKLIRIFIDKVLDEDMSLEEIVKESESQPVSATTPTTPVAPAAPVVAASAGATVLSDKIDQIMATEEYSLQVNPSSAAGSVMKSIQVFGTMFQKAVKIEQDFKFMIGKRQYSLAGIVEANGKKYGIEIPAIKTFDRSGGVAAFYALKRLTDAISTSTIEGGLLIVPKGTSGAKFVALLKKFENKAFACELTEDAAKFLIQQCMTQPTKEAYEMAKLVLGELPAYEAPKPPYDEKAETAAPAGEGEGEGGEEKGPDASSGTPPENPPPSAPPAA